MSDRELLELAAKAAGYRDAKWQDMSGWGEMRYGLSEAVYVPEIEDYWNPLVNDGDALRLAVSLNLLADPLFWHERSVEYIKSAMGGDRQDPYAATRRAIVRAAAAIGKTL